MSSSLERSRGSAATNSLRRSTSVEPCSVSRNFSLRRARTMKRADSRTAAAAPSLLERFEASAICASAARTGLGAPPAACASSCASAALKRSVLRAFCNSRASSGSTDSAPELRGEPGRLTFISRPRNYSGLLGGGGRVGLRGGRADQVGRLEQGARRARVRRVGLLRDYLAQLLLGLVAAPLEEQALGPVDARVEARGPQPQSLLAERLRLREAPALQLDRAERDARHVGVGEEFERAAEDGVGVVEPTRLAEHEARLQDDPQLLVGGLDVAQ